jgi:general secretion pathway protein I
LFQAMRFERPGEERDARAGFTLIEALVALAVAAVSLAAIGLLVAGNIRGSGRIEQHLGLVETLREVETGLPDRTSLSAGTLSGEMHGQAWSVDTAPFNLEEPRVLETKPIVVEGVAEIPGDVNPRAGRVWTPQTLVIKVQSPSGAVLQVETIRLGRRTSAQ